MKNIEEELFNMEQELDIPLKDRFYKLANSENVKTPIHFGRWLLKHCSICEGNSLCWIYMGEFYDTDELFEVFKNE